MDADAVQVLVVDDCRDSAQTLAALLRLDGYEVRTAHSGDEALAQIERVQPHCILFDVVMPGMDGDELCSRLRRQYGDDIVLIAVTGFTESDPRVDKTFGMADHYLSKPVDPQTLSKLLRPH